MNKSTRRELQRAANLATIEPEYATRCLCTLLRAAKQGDYAELLEVANRTGLRDRMTVVNGSFVPTIEACEHVSIVDDREEREDSPSLAYCDDWGTGVRLN